MLAWRAWFRDRHGARRHIPEYAHTHASWFQAFRAAGLEVVDCLEPAISSEVAAGKSGAEAFVRAFDAALAGQPGVLVWDLARP